MYILGDTQYISEEYLCAVGTTFRLATEGSEWRQSDFQQHSPGILFCISHNILEYIMEMNGKEEVRV